MTASNWSLFDLWATSCRIKQRAKQPAHCQIDSLSRWNQRQAVMWWGCVSVGAPRRALPGQTASLWLPVSLCVRGIVCGFCVGASALLCLGCLFTLQASGEHSFAGSCYCIPAPPRIRTLRFFCAPWMAPVYTCSSSGFFFFALIPHLNPTLTFLVRCQRFMTDWMLLPFSSWMRPDTSLGPISAPEGQLNCQRSSTRNEERTGAGKEGRQQCLC